MIILSQEMLVACFEQIGVDGQITLPFTAVDEGDVFTCIGTHKVVAQTRPIVQGVLQFYADVSQKLSFPNESFLFIAVRTNDFHCEAWINKQGRFEASPVQIIPLQAELYSRTRGLYETDVLKAKTVLIVGLGSGGGLTALELAKAGVGNFILVDYDRLEVANVARHVCGLSDLGRFKTKAVRDRIIDKNPSAYVETYEKRCEWNWLPQLRQLVQRADIVFGCTDNRASRALINLVGIQEKRVCIYGGAFKRAYGGQVLRVIPQQSICYQCFISILPDKAEDEEISNEAQVANFAYDDEHAAVTIEPGLATDIAPIINLCVKLGILEMLRGTETGLASLYEDLSNPLFQWLNRREDKTTYSKLEPMDQTNDYRILAWYGIPLKRDVHCPICGDYQLNSTHIELRKETVVVLEQFFNQPPDEGEQASTE